MATYNVASIQEAFEKYNKGQEYLSDVDVDIIPEENNVDPLEALKLYQGEKSLEDGLRLSTLLCVNKKVVFTKGPKVLAEFTPAVGKPIQAYLENTPYLVEIMCSVAWGILLKKLTPPLDGSATVGGESGSA